MKVDKVFCIVFSVIVFFLTTFVAYTLFSSGNPAYSPSSQYQQEVSSAAITIQSLVLGGSISVVTFWGTNKLFKSKMLN